MIELIKELPDRRRDRNWLGPAHGQRVTLSDRQRGPGFHPPRCGGRTDLDCLAHSRPDRAASDRDDYCAGSSTAAASSRFAASIAAAFFSTSSTRWSTISASFSRWSVIPLI